MRIFEKKWGAALRQLASGLVARHDAADFQRKLEAGIKSYAPEGTGPFPVAVLLHGCTGDPEHLESWARLLAANGYLSYTVDSLSPRGITFAQAACFVCTGLKLQGSERAGDVDAALRLIAADDRADKNKIHLLGWSHGAWTIMEWLHGETMPSAMRINSAIFTYPYCGIASVIHQKDWTHKMPVMFTTAGWDIVVPTKRTLALKDRLKSQGVPVTHVHLEKTPHGFDIEGRFKYNPVRTRELQKAIIAFMKAAA